MSDEWRVTTLGGAAVVLMGQSPPGDSYNTDGRGLPFMQGSAEFGEHYPKPVKWCSQPAKTAEPGDLLVSVRAPVGDTNFADRRIAIGRGLAIVRAHDGTLTHYLRLSVQAGLAGLLARSGSGMFSSITAANLRGFEVTLPPLSVQRRIVDVVGAVDAHIANLEAEHDSTMLTLQTIRDEVLTAQPDWNSGKLSDLLVIARGGSPRPIEAYLTDSPNGVKWIKIGDVPPGGKYIDATEQRIIPEGVKRSRTVKPGDFVLSNSMSFGRPYIVRIDGCIHDGWLMLSDPNGVFSPDFLYHLILTSNMQNQLEHLAAGSGVRNLNIKVVGSVEVTFPPIEEQRQLGRLLDSCGETANSLGTEVERLRELRSRLLEGLLSSELEIPEAYDVLLDAGVA